jgi:hypothetical protein
MDMTGKLIATTKGNALTQKLDVSALDNGMYILRIVKQGEVASKQFVIQK